MYSSDVCDSLTKSGLPHIVEDAFQRVGVGVGVYLRVEAEPMVNVISTQMKKHIRSVVVVVIVYGRRYLHLLD